MKTNRRAQFFFGADCGGANITAWGPSGGMRHAACRLALPLRLAGLLGGAGPRAALARKRGEASVPQRAPDLADQPPSDSLSLRFEGTDFEVSRHFCGTSETLRDALGLLPARP